MRVQMVQYSWKITWDDSLWIYFFLVRFYLRIYLSLAGIMSAAAAAGAAASLCSSRASARTKSKNCAKHQVKIEPTKTRKRIKHITSDSDREEVEKFLDSL